MHDLPREFSPSRCVPSGSASLRLAQGRSETGPTPDAEDKAPGFVIVDANEFSDLTWKLHPVVCHREPEERGRGDPARWIASSLRSSQ
jgi:hypothetical protein